MSARLARDKALGGKNEDYPTPAWCVHRLLDETYLPPGRWLEPCAGDGAIIRAVRSWTDFGDHGIAWTAVEIRKQAEQDLELTLAGAKGKRAPGRVIIGDFFEVAETLEPTIVRRRWPFDVVITNPPFSLAPQFIETCRTLAPIVVMLLKLSYFESAERNPLLRHVMPYQNKVLPDRPCFRGGKSDSSAYGWMIWTPDSGPECRTTALATTPRSIRRPKKARRGTKRAA